MRLIALTLLVALTAACADREPKLLNVKPNSQGGPDEFSILPNKPLVIPTGELGLPQPTKGANRADPTPQADAVIALGGNPNGGANDGGLVAYATRKGVNATVRQDLAREDLAFRRANDGRLLERVLNVNVYARAYRQQALDPYRELDRLRRAGVRTPSAPPRQN